MSVYFLADPHFGHKNIHRFRDFVDSPADNEAQIMHELLRTLTKRSISYWLGDVAFTHDALKLIQQVKGKKILIAGNHDDLPAEDYLSVFDDIRGILKYKGLWLTHAPMHPNELRGKFNLHGHVHDCTIDDPRYMNACVDHTYKTRGKFLLTLDEVRDRFWGKNTILQ